MFLMLEGIIGRYQHNKQVKESDLLKNYSSDISQKMNTSQNLLLKHLLISQNSPAIKLSYNRYPSLAIFADTAYLCWCHAVPWSGALETVLNDSRKLRVKRKGDTMCKKKQQTGEALKLGFFRRIFRKQKNDLLEEYVWLLLLAFVDEKDGVWIIDSRSVQEASSFGDDQLTMICFPLELNFLRRFRETLYELRIDPKTAMHEKERGSQANRSELH
ncbi:hypothetical protein Q9966_012181 [Columba livia]|nr:hypothetical protein Q9966_012181 [Columba livia]